MLSVSNDTTLFCRGEPCVRPRSQVMSNAGQSQGLPLQGVFVVDIRLWDNISRQTCFNLLFDCQCRLESSTTQREVLTG